MSTLKDINTDLDDVSKNVEKVYNKFTSSYKSNPMPPPI
jgi:hypothetical protein